MIRRYYPKVRERVETEVSKIVVLREIHGLKRNAAVAPRHDYQNLMNSRTAIMILYSTRRADSVITPVAKTAPISPRHATSSRPPPHRFNAIPFAISRNMPARSRHEREGGGGGGVEGRQKNRKKMQKFAVGHKCPNYLAAGIRSTRRLYGRRHRNLSGRRNLRDRRANERPCYPFSSPCRPLVVRIRIPTHQTIPLFALPPLQISTLSLLSPCVGQTNSAHFGFPERTVDAWQSAGKFSTAPSSFGKTFNCTNCAICHLWFSSGLKEWIQSEFSQCVKYRKWGNRILYVSHFTYYYL